MNDNNPTTILFTGYAPVHFVCFRPLYERLTQLDGVDVYVSGGLRSKAESGYLYDEKALFAPFGVPSERVLSVDEIKRRPFDVLFAANTKLIMPQSVGKRVQIFHGISFRNRAIRAENMTCDYYFLIGPYMQRKFVDGGLLQDNDPRGIQIGFPKLDRLVDGSLQRSELLATFGFDGSRRVILYAPTGEKHNSLETMGEEVIRRIDETGQYDLLIKLHDHPKNQEIDWPVRLASLENDHVKVARDLDVVPLLFLADLLITDASSVSSEYTLLDRPMIFLDVPELIARAMTRKASMLDMDTWGRRAGTIVKRPEVIVDVVEASLANPDRHAAVRREMADDLFFNPGTATDHAIAWLKTQLSEGSARQLATSQGRTPG